MDRYYAVREEGQHIDQKSQSLLKTIKTHIQRCERKLLLQQKSLEDSEKMEEYRIKGDLINANTYHISQGMAEVKVDNFYDPNGGQLVISLDTQLTPTQNAQAYFKKYQKAKSAKEAATFHIEKTKEELLFLDGAYLDAQKSVSEADLMEVREELYKAGYIKNAQKKKGSKHQGKSKPYHYQSQDGIDIFVGKNAVQNERITFGAQGEETWLHAKELPGSHVVIKHKGEVPENTLLEGAQLAAYYSKGRSGSQVAIDYTQRRHVKKPGGSPTGFVIYTNQKTLYITVTDQDVQRITLIDA